MADVLEELTADVLLREQVETRLDDWARRIDDLYAMTRSWLPNGWTARVARSVRIYEEPMREVGLGPRHLPVLDLVRNATEGVIEPRGLWIIGMNGRLDLRMGASRFLLIDKAENLKVPNWRIASASDRSQLAPYDRQALETVLDQA